MRSFYKEKFYKEKRSKKKFNYKKDTKLNKKKQNKIKIKNKEDYIRYICKKIFDKDNYNSLDENNKKLITNVIIGLYREKSVIFTKEGKMEFINYKLHNDNFIVNKNKLYFDIEVDKFHVNKDKDEIRKRKLGLMNYRITFNYFDKNKKDEFNSIYDDTQNFETFINYLKDLLEREFRINSKNKERFN